MQRALWHNRLWITCTSTMFVSLADQQKKISLSTGRSDHFCESLYEPAEVAVKWQGRGWWHCFRAPSKGSIIIGLGTWTGLCVWCLISRCSKCTGNSRWVVTKHPVLQSIAAVFDPIGAAAPVVVHSKLLLHKLWQMCLPWDKPRTHELKQQLVESSTSSDCTVRIIAEIIHWAHLGRLVHHC